MDSKQIGYSSATYFFVDQLIDPLAAAAVKLLLNIISKNQNPHVFVPIHCHKCIQSLLFKPLGNSHSAHWCCLTLAPPSGSATDACSQLMLGLKTTY